MSKNVSVIEKLQECMNTGFLHHNYCIYGFDSVELNEDGDEWIINKCHFNNSEVGLLTCANCKYYRLDISKCYKKKSSE